MKNLFSINKTTDPNAMDFDVTPYHAATVSDEIKAKLKGAFSVVEEEYAPHDPTPEEIALRKKGNRYWLLTAAFLIGGVALFFGGSNLGIYDSMPYLLFLDLALVICAMVFNFKARRINRKQTEMSRQNASVDFAEASKKLEEAAAEAAAELGIPAGALTVDVFPYHYKVNGDKILRVGKKGKYDNLAVSVFVKDKTLCLATAQELFAIPLNEIRGYREYDEDFELDMWLKPEEPDSDKYKPYGLRKSGFFSHKAHGYFGLLLGGEYEVLIPCYDFGEIKTLLATNGVEASEA
ncbi:MAG: hypothetical protein IJD38_04070 [Clostridia bacterium]|nr:hypothetical protein [Clostridia bacterium]